MKFRMLALTTMLMMLWVAAVPVAASDEATGKTTTGDVAVAKPVVVLPEMTFEFKPVVDGTKVTHDFAIKNTGDGPLAIQRVKTRFRPSSLRGRTQTRMGPPEFRR